MKPAASPRKTAAKRAAIPLERQGPFPVAMRCVKPRAYGTTEAVIASAFDQAGGVKVVCDLLGLKPSIVYGFTDDKREDCELSLDRARRVAQFTGATAFAEDFCALAGGVFLSPEKMGEGEDLADLGGDIGHSIADFVGELLKAIADGNISNAERAGLRQRLDKAIAFLVAARGRLMQGATE